MSGSQHSRLVQAITQVAAVIQKGAYRFLRASHLHHRLCCGVALRVAL